MRCRGVVTIAEVGSGRVQVRLRRGSVTSPLVICHNLAGAHPGDGVEVEVRPAWDTRLRVALPLIGVGVGTVIGPALGWRAGSTAALAGAVGFLLAPWGAWCLRRMGYGEWVVRKVLVRPCVRQSPPAGTGRR